MSTTTTKHSRLWPLAVGLLSLGLASLACNMPYLAGKGEQIQAELIRELAQDFGQPVGVSLEADTLVLSYEVPLLQAQETTAIEVARLMELGAVKAGRAEWVRVELLQQGAPALAVTGKAKDARLLADGRLTVGAFLDGLSFDDRRPVEQALRQDLERLGYSVRSVSYRDGVVELSFWQPEIDSTQALVQSWLPIWALAVVRAPEAGQVVLHAGMLGQPDLRVDAPAEHLRDFQSGRLTPAEFLLGLDVQEE